MELGWSGFPGRAEVQKKAFEDGIPMKLKAWKSPAGRAIMNKYVKAVLPLMWQIACDRYWVECSRMRDLNLGDVYGLFGTGWNKVTRRGPAVGTCRSEVLSQKCSDPKSVGAAAVGRAVRPDRAS
jgi:hypothetical protein